MTTRSGWGGCRISVLAAAAVISLTGCGPLDLSGDTTGSVAEGSPEDAAGEAARSELEASRGTREEAVSAEGAPGADADAANESVVVPEANPLDTASAGTTAADEDEVEVVGRAGRAPREPVAAGSARGRTQSSRPAAPAPPAPTRQTEVPSTPSGSPQVAAPRQSTAAGQTTAASQSAGRTTTPPPPTGAQQAAPAGPLTNRTASFTAAGHTADYRLYAEGLSTSRPIGLLVYADGTGEYGLENPTSSYAIGGPAGLAAVARERNMVLLTPFSPNQSCECWEQGDATGHAAYLAALITQVKAQYGTGELWMTGYSSGAQAATRFLFPAHPGLWSGGGGVVAIGGGGAPASRSVSIPAAVKSSVVLRWDTGALDTGAGGGFNALSGAYGAQAGERWYAGQGLDTRLVVPAGVGHSRSGEFGRIIGGFIGRR